MIDAPSKDHRTDKRKIQKKENLAIGWGCDDWRNPKPENKGLKDGHKLVYSRYYSKHPDYRMHTSTEIRLNPTKIECNWNPRVPSSTRASK